VVRALVTGTEAYRIHGSGPVNHQTQGAHLGRGGLPVVFPLQVRTRSSLSTIGHSTEDKSQLPNCPSHNPLLVHRMDDSIYIRRVHE